MTNVICPLLYSRPERGRGGWSVEMATGETA